MVNKQQQLHQKHLSYHIYIDLYSFFKHIFSSSSCVTKQPNGSPLKSWRGETEGPMLTRHLQISLRRASTAQWSIGQALHIFLQLFHAVGHITNPQQDVDHITFTKREMQNEQLKHTKSWETNSIGTARSRL